MKNVTLLSIFLAIAVYSTAQTPFFVKTTYRGAFGANNWTSGWANFDPQTTTYPATTASLTGEITSNTTLDKSKVYKIDGFVYVRNGATLTIPAGTILRGDKSTKATIIVTKGSKIMAEGTLAEPIIFTSNEAAGSRDYGDWGGIIILGAAPVNTAGGSATIEGGVNNANNDGAYGGTNATDNSGVMTYCRIEFPGVAFQPDNEINGLTLGGVGAGTKLSYIQVSYSGDDAIEWFGGNIDCDHLITFRTWDDEFDTDFGYSGRVQFGVALRDPKIADKSGSNGFESDNDGTGSDNAPYTNATFCNMTVIGPGANADLSNSAEFNSNFKRALHIRRNSRCSVFNSVYIGYPVGLLLDGTKTLNQFIGGGAEFKNNVIAYCPKPLDTASTKLGNPTFDVATWFNGTGFNNSILPALADVKLGSYALTSPNFLPQAGSPLLAGSDFTHNRLLPLAANVGVFDQVLAGTNVYPNPAKGYIDVNFVDANSANAHIALYDNTGRLVTLQNISNLDANTLRVSLENVTAGMYFLVIDSENTSASHKISVN